MFSQTAEYALRAVVCLAQAEGKSLTAREISESTRVPANYLSKVLHLLARAGLVKSLRGIHGGYLFANDAASVSVLDVLGAVDTIKRIRVCPLDNPEHTDHLCTMHQKLDNVFSGAEAVLGKTTIAELLCGSDCTRPMYRINGKTHATAAPSATANGS